MALQVIDIAYFAYFLQANGYLPSPFVLNKFDTFMDLYNTMWWGAQDGRYTEWGSVYPPLNFIILAALRLVFFPQGVFGDPLDIQAANLWPAYIVCALHLVAPFFVVFTKDWREFATGNRWLVAAIAVISPIFLFSMERGNLIILPLFLLPFLFSHRDSRAKPWMLAVLINLKPYFALLLLAHLVKGDWRRLLEATAYAGAIFIFTGLVVDPNFPLFLPNLLSFAGNDAVLSGREVLALPSSLSAFSYAIDIFLKSAVSTGIFESPLPSIPFIAEAVKTVILLFAGYALFVGRKTAGLPELFVIFLLIAVDAGIWAGGYSQIFFLAAVPVMAAMPMRVSHLSILLLIFLPWDLLTLYTDPTMYMESWISRSIVEMNWQLGLGTIVRPLLNALLIISVSVDLIGRQQRHETMELIPA